MLKECQTKDLGSILAHGDYNYGLGEPVGDTSTSAIDMIRSFDPSSFGAVSLIKLAHKMYALEKANSSLGQLKGTKKPKIDLDDPDDVAGLRHHVIVHAATGMLRAGVSDAATIPMWDRQAFIRGVEKQCSHDMKAELVAPNDARSINVLRGYVNFLITRIQEVALSLEYLDSALNNGQVTRVDRTVPQLETLAKVTEDYDEFSYLLVAKIKHLLWLVDMQEDPETRGLLLPELECYINSAEQAGVKRSRLSIDFGVDTGASEGTFRPPYNITAFDQLKHTGLDEYAVPDIVCDVVPVDELLRSIRRSGNCEPTSHNAEKYSLPWGADIQQFDVPRVTDERVLSGGSVHGVTRQTYDNGRTTITKQRNTGSPAELPNMVTEASEMKYEAHALRVAAFS